MNTPAKLALPALLLALLAALTALTTSSSQAARPLAHPSDWTAFPVSTAPDDQVLPTVGDNAIFWADRRDYALNSYDIYGYNLATQQEFPLIVAPLRQDQPATSGDWLVYRQSTTSDQDFTLQAIRLSTREVITLAGGTANPINPDISGNRVIWQDTRNYGPPRNGGYDIYGYDLATNTEFSVTNALDNQFTPRISGNVAVWWDLRNRNTTGGDIYGHDFTTGLDFPICTAPGLQRSPAISGNIVVWADYRNDPSAPDIYGYNLLTHQEFPIAVYNGTTQDDPRVGGDWVVWDDDRSGAFSRDIMGYYLPTGQEVVISSDPAGQTAPDIRNNVAAWQDYRNASSGADIYAALAPPPPSPTATATVLATATATRTPGASPTPISCTTSFTDVPGGNPFYPYIQWMACRGYISGYACGGDGEPCDPNNTPYFRPNNTVTRSQLLKMVVNAAGWPISTPATPTFNDVPANNAFAAYIETGVAHGIIAGYTCGGPGEPCDPPANRPYFRPFANITRAQLSKVIALARNYPLPAPATPTFADVPASSPFYAFIEAMIAQAIVSGYGCGGAGEPCDPPANRPYFRPFNSATRAQVAKFVTLAYGGP